MLFWGFCLTGSAGLHVVGSIEYCCSLTSVSWIPKNFYQEWRDSNNAVPSKGEQMEVWVDDDTGFNVVPGKICNLHA